MYYYGQHDYDGNIASSVDSAITAQAKLVLLS